MLHQTYGVSTGEEVRLELESLRRDVACLMQEMRQVKTALSNLRRFAGEWHGKKEFGPASFGTGGKESRQASAIATDVVPGLRTAMQPQFSEYVLGTPLHGEVDERGERKEAMGSDRSNPDRGAVGGKRSSFRRESAYPHVDDVPRQRRYEGKTAEDADGVRVADYVPGSVYVWACGEKLDPSDEDVTASEVVVGWITILVQVAAYVVLITGASSNDGDANYSIYSISLAMFLMISISSSDIRASHALLFWGGSWGRCLFGAVLLGCTGLLITASLRVLFMDAGNNAELVIGAATVLFIEDVDDKLATFLTSVPREWRLFWMLEILAASLWLAIIGVMEFGNSSAVLDKDIKDSGFRLQELVGYDWLCSMPWILTMWAMFLSHLVVHKIRGIQVARRARQALVLPVTSGSVPSDSMHQTERKSCQEVLVQGLCLFVSVGFIFTEFLWVRGFFSFRGESVFVYFGGVFFFSLVGGLRAFFDSEEAWFSRRTLDPQQFTWYRMLVGWGFGTFCYLVYYWPVPYEIFPLVVDNLFIVADLVLIVEPAFFGKWGGHWIRTLQEYTMTKNGCIYWTVYFHVVYSAVWWTISVYFFMTYIID